jgi:excinuclease ABC subunit A
MPASDIVIKGAREHNLRDVDVVLPRNKLICLTGVSGSGKSSLAFDTVYAEGQRRYVESLSSFARQFLGQMPKPDVDYLGGLSPSISISQKSTGHNPRSTVGTVTEIYDYLRLLYARVGQGHCPSCNRAITSQSREQIVARILELPAGAKFSVLAPVVRAQKGEHRDLFEDLLKQGFVRARVDGDVVQLTDELSLDRRLRHDIEVVIDRLVVKGDIRSRLAEAVELAIKTGKGAMIVALEQGDAAAAQAEVPAAEAEPASGSKERGKSRRGAARPGDLAYSIDYACSHCGLSFEPPSPQLFSFNSPQGMCPQCDGLGAAYTFDPQLLIPDDALSFKQGAIELIGPWKEMGRWRRHIFQGVAETMERKLGLEASTLLETPWRKLTPEQQAIWLDGTGDQHITFTWRGGAAPTKYGGKFEGIVPELLGKYRGTKSSMHLRQLEKYMNTVHCTACRGERLLPQARFVRVTSGNPRFAENASRSLPEICRLSVSDAADYFQQLVLDATSQRIATEVLKEIRGRLGFLINVGLEYLTLDRTAPTLSGGESQRIRLAGQIGSGLVGVTYILDEPSIGLHPRDNDRLLATLHRLRDMGNTVVVVEHDEDTMWAADHVLDFGPGPGVRGGELVSAGSPEHVAQTARSVTGQFLSGKRKIEIPSARRPRGEKTLKIRGAAHNNLKGVDVDIPLGSFVCVTGVSGSGKSSLVNDILVEALRRDLNGGEGNPGAYASIEGLDHLDKLIDIDQSPIGRTPRSNPGTYIKLFDEIRDLYCQLPEAKRRGYKPGRFSFNVAGGRCEACEGNGSTKLDMDFLADVWVICPVCEGKRFNRETLQVRFKDKSIADVLEMDVQQALVLFENVPHVRHRLQTLHDVGLDYIKIGQPSPTLSGGEAQRVKLARELVKKSTGKTLYLLDEPTTGLHFADIDLLLKVLHRFVAEGNTVLVVEHNLDVIKTADYVIDIGPEGGAAGGRVIVVGTPEEVAACEESHTGRSLRPVLEGRQAELARSKAKDAAKITAAGRNRVAEISREIRVDGAQMHNLKSVDCVIPRDRMTVFCGPSGSGKSSLAMDTIYAEGQRRYVESLSSYARQFVAQMQKPVVEHIEGLSPAIAIEQKNLGHTPRSTVGTVTEIYDYLRILFARLGAPYCPACDIPIGTQTADEIVDKILAEPAGTKLYLMAPVEVEVGQQYQTVWDDIRARGYARIRVNGKTHATESPPTIDRRRKHRVEIVVDRISVQPQSRSRIAESIEQTLALGKGVMHVARVSDEIPETDWEVIVHSQHRACDQCGRSFEPLTPHNFSFNSSLGWCPTCEGLGTQVGANPAALLRGASLTLRNGALAIWPDVSLPVSQAMLVALSEGTGIPLDVPYDQLSARHRRFVLHGTDERWFGVPAPGAKKNGSPLFRFQFKGLYPALEEASRLSPTFRSRLEAFVGEVECGTCSGSRLRDDASAVRFRGRTIEELCRLPLGQLQELAHGWNLSERERKIAGELLREIGGRMQFLTDVGLEYLSLSRGAATLSNGEAQRIRLASQLGSGLCGVLYVLDEPTIGLHPRDNTKLLRALHKLRDLGNTLLVVEHDREVIENCDKIIDFGPGAGKFGGQIVADGTPQQVAKKKDSVTGPYLSNKKAIPIPSNRRVPVIGNSEDDRSGKATAAKSGRKKKAATPAAPSHPPATEIKYLSVLGARGHNLKNIDVHIPLGTLTAITGPSGTGKSTVIEDILYASLARTLHRASVVPGPHDKITGIEHINKVIRVDQQPLGNSPASNPATYTGVFELVRQLFSQLPEAKVRGYSARRFSFNVPGGRCEACEGDGQRRVEMHFLPDVWVECETCRGKRYNAETLTVTYHGQSIADVLSMTCREALQLLENIPAIRRILQTLCDVGLDYLTLGQPAPTLSGGEAQRVKLAAELSRPDTGRTLYLLDEPTTGLHFDDLAKLLEVMQRLVDLGNTVVVIEHNLDIIKCCDWLIDLGPEAGEAGGQVVMAGTPEQLVAHAERTMADKSLLRSYTGEALAPVLAAGPFAERRPYDPLSVAEKRDDDKEIDEVGRTAKMPWETDGRIWHTRDRVGRKGEPCQWDGRILEQVVDRIQELGGFAETNWNDRSIVEITGEKKSDGWFLHAITGEAWLLKMKFRVYRGTFQRDDLQQRIQLQTLNEMANLPVYGNEPRVKVKTLQGPWQEVEIRVHSLDEIDTPSFWSFLEEAVQGFFRFTERAEVNKEELQPWKALGRKWHFLRKGFPPGKKVQWEQALLEEVFEMLAEACPEGQFLWNNQQIVNLMPRGARTPWAVVGTKRPEHVALSLVGPKGHFTYGQLVDLAESVELVEKDRERDVIHLRIQSVEELHRTRLAMFLREHLEAAMGANV